jgi:rare lipoprotein A
MSTNSFRAGLVFAGSCFLLAACGGGYTTRIIDSPETRYLKAHQRPYSVNGRRYDPLADSNGFSERGMASWYGRDFHGRKTSNGEIYDMNAMTGAHKTLPMGTWVQVTNEENGRQVKVRINDRGPFVKGRIIDVSYAAAKRLGLVGPGTAPVRIECLADNGPAVPVKDISRPRDISLTEAYAVQVGAFTLRENARRLADKLEEKTGSADIYQDRVGDTLFYRVTAGRYANLAEAEIARGRLEQQGYTNCFVVAKQ